MAHDTRRPDRVAEAIREEVAMFLAEGVKDPRVVGGAEKFDAYPYYGAPQKPAKVK